MPVKVFSAPGDHSNDFKVVEDQVNAWIEQARPRIISIHPAVNALEDKRNVGDFMLTLVVYYEKPGA